VQLVVSYLILSLLFIRGKLLFPIERYGNRQPIWLTGNSRSLYLGLVTITDKSSKSQLKVTEAILLAFIGLFSETRCLKLLLRRFGNVDYRQCSLLMRYRCAFDPLGCFVHPSLRAHCILSSLMSRSPVGSCIVNAITAPGSVLCIADGASFRRAASIDERSLMMCV